MITAVDCTIIRFKRDLVDRSIFIISRNRTDILGRSKSWTGATRQRISRSNLGSIVLPRPPLPEQQRTVAILDGAFAGLATATANAEKNFKSARELFDGYLGSIFENNGGGDWNSSPLMELTDKSSPITYGVVKPGTQGDIVFIRGGDVSHGSILISQLRTISSAVSSQHRRTLLSGGEILISLVGQPGQVAIVPPELAGANIARQVGLVRLRPGIEAKFVAYFLRSTTGQKSLGAYKGGSVQQVINLADLRLVQVPLPPLHLQTQIAATLDKLEVEATRLSAKYQAKIFDLAELKQSILQKAFSGGLPPSSAIKEAAE